MAIIASTALPPWARTARPVRPPSVRSRDRGLRRRQGVGHWAGCVRGELLRAPYAVVGPMGNRRRVLGPSNELNWQNLVTVVSVMILIGTEVFGVALAAGWASPACSSSATRSACL